METVTLEEFLKKVTQDPALREKLPADPEAALEALRRMAEDRVGERCAIGYRWKSMARRGIPMGGGSDSPVETFNPVWGIHCAVNRTGRDGLPEGGWRPEEMLSVFEAVRLYTSEGAYLTFEEAEKGMLRPGMLADMAVLDRDIFAVPQAEIMSLRNVMTIMDGNIVYTA